MLFRSSRDGRRVYVTNSLYSPWDAQFYPDGIRGWMAKLDVGAEGGITFDPKLVGSVHIGGIVRRAPHPSDPAKPLNGAPQMVEVSRDGRRVYLTNSLYSPWDAQFYPDGLKGWMAKLDVGVDGGMAFDPRFFPELGEGMRPHQVRLQGGDASSDSFCFA